MQTDRTVYLPTTDLTNGPVIEGTYRRLADGDAFTVRIRINGQDPRGIAMRALEKAGQARRNGNRDETWRGWLTTARHYNWLWENAGQRLPR